MNMIVLKALQDPMPGVRHPGLGIYRCACGDTTVALPRPSGEAQSVHDWLNELANELTSYADKVAAIEFNGSATPGGATRIWGLLPPTPATLCLTCSV